MNKSARGRGLYHKTSFFIHSSPFLADYTKHFSKSPGKNIIFNLIGTEPLGISVWTKLRALGTTPWTEGGIANALAGKNNEEPSAASSLVEIERSKFKLAVNRRAAGTHVRDSNYFYISNPAVSSRSRSGDLLPPTNLPVLFLILGETQWASGSVEWHLRQWNYFFS